MNKLIILAHVFIVCFLQVQADTPANCTFEDISGVWTIIEGPRGQDKNVSCYNLESFEIQAIQYKIKLLFPDVAIDEHGNEGFWTLIYNQGFELVINDRKYFAFSKTTKDGNSTTSYCDQTMGSTSHDAMIDPVNWSCFYGLKFDGGVKKITSSNWQNDKTFYRKNSKLVDKINDHQSSWKAGHYEFLEQRTLSDLVRMSGGKNTKNFNNPPTTVPTEEALREAESMPASFTWTNVNGTNWISPIRNQGESCGSCYAFASMALQEAKFRIQSNMTQQPVFSTQDVVECSKYSQGCEGGFPYLVAGKYAEDYGLVEEECNKYLGVDGVCHTNKTCTRHYGTNYRYIGGFYGGCNEPLMRIALVKNGPLAVSFQIYDDFLNYKSGIYHHTGLSDQINFEFNPWEVTNHGVLVVGYGTEANTDYWIVKNSWGTEWGEQGYFRIRRGTDECSIESIAVEVDAVLNK